MVAVSNKKHERLKKYKKYAVGDDIASEYSRIVRPIDDTTIAYLIAVNEIDITEDDCIKKIENAMAEEREVANELQKVLDEAEIRGFFT